MKTHQVTFDKEKHEIRINGLIAGFIDGSKNLEFKAESDEHGEKIIVTEIIPLHSPLENGATEIRAVLMILRPWVEAERAARAKEAAKARENRAKARIEAWRARVIGTMNVEFNEGLEGQAKLGGFF